MNVDASDLVDLFTEYALRLRRRDEHIERVQRERDDLIQTMQHLHRDLELWRRALVSATGEEHARPLGAVYPRVQ